MIGVFAIVIEGNGEKPHGSRDWTYSVTCYLHTPCLNGGLIDGMIAARLERFFSSYEASQQTVLCILSRVIKGNHFTSLGCI